MMSSWKYSESPLVDGDRVIALLVRDLVLAILGLGLTLGLGLGVS